jgi:hypothetical protein
MTIQNIKSVLLATSLLTSFSASAFSVDDHEMITEIAIQEMKECGLLPQVMNYRDNQGRSAEDVVVKYNVREDNYLINGFKKTFTYSHFYNPLRPLADESRRAYHADQAVLDYASFIKKTEKNRGSQKDILERAGMITHMIQDASSPPHVLWINHAMFDGFENKVKVSRVDLTAEETDCSRISLAGLKSPVQIMKAAGLATLKELEEDMHYQKLSSDESGLQSFTMPWSQGFFTNSELYTNRILEFLRDYDLLRPVLDAPASEEELSKGEYGSFSDDISNVTLRGDNFGRSRFEVKGEKIHVNGNQYVQLRKTLMRQSILSTQRLILWLGTAKESTVALP